MASSTISSDDTALPDWLHILQRIFRVQPKIKEEKFMILFATTPAQIFPSIELPISLSEVIPGPYRGWTGSPTSPRLPESLLCLLAQSLEHGRDRCDWWEKGLRSCGEYYAACDIVQRDWIGGVSVLFCGGISKEGHTDLDRIADWMPLDFGMKSLNPLSDPSLMH